MTAADASPAARLHSARGRWIVAGMVLGSTTTFVSATVANVALPEIGATFATGFAGLQWVSSAYLLALAALVLPGGSAADIFGRRAAFLVGLTVFAAGSLVAALAPSLPLLIVARLVQGSGAALVTPASLAIIDGSFHPDDRSRAIGSWASGSAVAAATGPLVGGYVVDAISWRWIFLVPLPLAAAAAAVTLRHVPETRDDALGRHLDLPGAAIGLTAVSGIVYALVQAPGEGVDAPAVLAAGAVGVAAAVVFVSTQRRRPDPMVPPRLFRSVQFSGANLFTLLVYLAVGGAFFFTAIQFQTSLGYTALAAGAALVPMNLVTIVWSPQAGALAARYGPRPLVTAGPVIAAGGLLGLALVDVGDDYATRVLPGVLLLGLGLSTTVGPLTASVFAAVTERDLGIASAINSAVARAGGLLATAFLPLVAGVTAADGLDRFATGYERALVIAAVLCLASAALGAATIGRAVALHTSQQASPISGCIQRSLPSPAPEDVQALAGPRTRRSRRAAAAPVGARPAHDRQQEDPR